MYAQAHKSTLWNVQAFDANGVKVASKYFKYSVKKERLKAGAQLKKFELAGLTTKLVEV